jgi:hypothetical protein
MSLSSHLDLASDIMLIGGHDAFTLHALQKVRTTHKNTTEENYGIKQ